MGFRSNFSLKAFSVTLAKAACDVSAAYCVGALAFFGVGDVS